MTGDLARAQECAVSDRPPENSAKQHHHLCITSPTELTPKNQAGSKPCGRRLAGLKDRQCLDGFKTCCPREWHQGSSGPSTGCCSPAQLLTGAKQQPLEENEPRSRFLDFHGAHVGSWGGVLELLGSSSTLQNRSSNGLQRMSLDKLAQAFCAPALANQAAVLLDNLRRVRR